MTWQDQVRFTELFGPAFVETSSANRKKHPKTPDPRIGVFSNDPSEGLTGQGTEGWHVDGNVVQNPHQFTIIRCVSSMKASIIAKIRVYVQFLYFSLRYFFMLKERRWSHMDCANQRDCRGSNPGGTRISRELNFRQRLQR